MKVRQVIRVRIYGTPNVYAYAFEFDPATETLLRIGERVEMPSNREGTVTRLGGDYIGDSLVCVQRVPDRRYLYRRCVGCGEMMGRSMPFGVQVGEFWQVVWHGDCANPKDR